MGNMTSDLSLGTLLVSWTVSDLSTYEGLRKSDKRIPTAPVGFLTASACL